MIKIPHDAEQLTQKLPQEILDKIQLQMLLWTIPALVEMGPMQLTKKQMKKFMKRSLNERIKLLRAAKDKLEKERGVQ